MGVGVGVGVGVSVSDTYKHARTHLQVMAGTARKRPGGPGQEKHCSWCGMTGHRNKKAKPCTNPPREVAAREARAELEAATAAKAKAEKKKERQAARDATKKSSKRKSEAAPAAKSQKAPGKRETPPTKEPVPPQPKVSPSRMPPTDRSSARAAQEAKEGERGSAHHLFDTEGEVPELEIEEPETKVKEETSRRSQRTAAENKTTQRSLTRQSREMSTIPCAHVH